MDNKKTPLRDIAFSELNNLVFEGNFENVNLSLAVKEGTDFPLYVKTQASGNLEVDKKSCKTLFSEKEIAVITKSQKPGYRLFDRNTGTEIMAGNIVKELSKTKTVNK